MAESEPPARGEGGAPGGAAVDQPDQPGEGDDQQRQQMKRRQGACRGDPEDHGDQRPPPAGERHDPLFKSAHSGGI